MNSSFITSRPEPFRIKNEVGTSFPVFLLLTVPRWHGAAFVGRIFNLYFMFILVLLSSDLNINKPGPGITMLP